MPTQIESRELLMQGLASKTVAEIHRIIHSDQLTDAEAKLVFLRVLEELVSSATIAAQADVLREQLTSPSEPDPGMPGSSSAKPEADG